MRTLLILAAILTTTAPAFAQTEPREFGCGRILNDSNGKTVRVTEPPLSILELTRSGAFTPPPPPEGLTAVAYHCQRSELLPATNDWKVFEAGAALMIIADVNGAREQLLLEMEDGRLRVRVRSGVLTDDQRAQLREFLNTNQKRFYKD